MTNTHFLVRLQIKISILHDVNPVFLGLKSVDLFFLSIMYLHTPLSYFSNRRDYVTYQRTRFLFFLFRTPTIESVSTTCFFFSQYEMFVSFFSSPGKLSSQIWSSQNVFPLSFILSSFVCILTNFPFTTFVLKHGFLCLRRDCIVTDLLRLTKVLDN